MLDPTSVKVEDQVIAGQHTSEEIRDYLDSLINISSEKISVDDVLRGLVWNLRIVDPQARVVKVFKAVREKMLQHGLTEEDFSEKSRIKDSVPWLLCHRR